jgi:hypothetical protein
MLYFVVALFFFFDAVLIHLLVCRQAKKEGLLLKLFIAIAGVNLLVCWVMFYFLLKFTSGSTSLWFTPFIAGSTALYILLIPTYLVFYFSTVQVSPSKKIMLLLNERPMSFQDLNGYFKDDQLIAPRIEELLSTGCLARREGRYALTFSGCQMARLYALYQTVLGRKKGG